MEFGTFSYFRGIAFLAVCIQFRIYGGKEILPVYRMENVQKCEGNNVTFDFRGHNGNTTTTVQWFFILNDTEKELIAWRYDQDVDVSPKYIKDVIITKEQNWALINVSVEQSGHYLKEIINGGTSYSVIDLFVKAAPSGSPELKSVEDDGRDILVIRLPKHIGIPEVHYGIKQTTSSVNKNMDGTYNLTHNYEVCLRGSAVECLVSPSCKNYTRNEIVDGGVVLEKPAAEAKEIDMAVVITSYIIWFVILVLSLALHWAKSGCNYVKLPSFTCIRREKWTVIAIGVSTVITFAILTLAIFIPYGPKDVKVAMVLCACFLSSLIYWFTMALYLVWKEHRSSNTRTIEKSECEKMNVADPHNDTDQL